MPLRCSFCRNDKPAGQQFGQPDPAAAHICEDCVARVVSEGEPSPGATCSFCLRTSDPGRDVYRGPETSTTFICIDCLGQAKRELQRG